MNDARPKIVSDNALLKRVRRLIVFFVVGLVLSGLTAFPLLVEARLLRQYFGAGTVVGQAMPALAVWLEKVYVGLRDTSERHPFLFYGTDWLAFAHLVIAVAFLGPFRDPVRNRWVIQFGMIACALVIPLAIIAGSVRGIPLFWRIIDCSFGVVGFVPLWFADRAVARLTLTEK
ncbi:MAG: hypothetical protein KKH28_12410 [Elusimicrobia bacterium]|nr:hypothetical protein [Elusimicrobiota bacterium]